MLNNEGMTESSELHPQICRFEGELKANGITRPQMLRELGYSKGQYQNWRKVRGIPSTEWKRCAEYVGVNQDWLVKGNGPKKSAASTAPPSVLEDAILESAGTGFIYVRTPVVGTAQLGDNGYYNELEYPAGHGEGYLDFPTKDKNAYALRVKGDSMHPAIRDGWYVLVEPNTPISMGEFVLVKCVDGRKMIKELLWDRNGEYTLVSVNDSHGRITLSHDEVTDIQAVGAIVPQTKFQPE